MRASPIPAVRDCAPLPSNIVNDVLRTEIALVIVAAIREMLLQSARLLLQTKICSCEVCNLQQAWFSSLKTEGGFEVIKSILQRQNCLLVYAATTICSSAQSQLEALTPNKSGAVSSLQSCLSTKLVAPKYTFAKLCKHLICRTLQTCTFTL